MRYRALDASGDATFGSGQTAFLVNSPEAVRQAIITRLLLWQGEWFLNSQEGTPFMQQILQNNTAASRDLAVRARVLETVGVRSIAKYSSSYNSATRSFSASLTVDTVYGQVSVVI